MLAGWRDQQLARNLSKRTIEDRLSAVQRFQRFTNEWPWTWRPADVEEYTAHLRSDGRERSHSTIRGYHGHVRLFLEYAADPRGRPSASDSSAPIRLRCSSSGTRPCTRQSTKAVPDGVP
ncbi:phage integrase N-terminal SAM-like domain-containing protein [Streptomyces sp. SAS_272]|uniref:phage integrase N-terminal SAM-like domain-containing protein n=1 Tax=Streptomyces sp. SAS_272 TaxID=3412747 RepID=UPI00403D0A16